MTNDQIRKRKNTALLRRYGITVDEWDALLASQGFLCGCGCGKKYEPGKRWSVDHDHVTGEVRGIVSWQCNRYVVGSFTVETAYRVYIYLSDPPARKFFGEPRFVPKGMEKGEKKRRKRRTVKRDLRKR